MPNLAKLELDSTGRCKTSVFFNAKDKELIFAHRKQIAHELGQSEDQISISAIVRWALKNARSRRKG